MEKLELDLLTRIVAQQNQTLSDLALVKELLYELASKLDVKVDNERLQESLESIQRNVDEEQKDVFEEIFE